VLIVNQEMVVRLGAVTGVGYARLISERFGRFWGWFSVAGIFLLNFLTISTEFMGISLAGEYFGLKSAIVIPIATLILIDVALHYFVVKPVARLSATADEISRGNLEVSELPVRGKDEISVLASSFNRMYVSLRKALRLLDEQ